jgi:hypothetical protein
MTNAVSLASARGRCGHVVQVSLLLVDGRYYIIAICPRCDRETCR